MFSFNRTQVSFLGCEFLPKLFRAFSIQQSRKQEKNLKIVENSIVPLCVVVTHAIEGCSLGYC